MDKQADLPEEEEKEQYWETHDTSDYVDWMDEPPIVLPHPQADTKLLPLSLTLFEALEAEAIKHGVSCQALAEGWLKEKLKQR